MADAPSALKTSIEDATKAAMKAREKQRVAALRLIGAELKRIEVDERKTLSDDDVRTILNRMVKQRRDSLGQYETAGREDLAEQERFELALIQEFLPQPLSEDELQALVRDAVASTGASGMKDMGAVMGAVKARAEGRADMAEVSRLVKAALG